MVLLAASCGNSSKYNFQVEGKLSNLTQSEVFAVREISGDSIVIDTIAVDKDGKFLYKGLVDRPTLVNLFCGDNTDQITFFLEPDYDVKLSADVQDFGMAELKGGKVNEDLMAFKKENESLLQTRCRLLGKHGNIDQLELKNINFQLARRVREYVEKNPTKIASVILMNNYSINNISPEIMGNDIELLKGEASDFYLTTSLKKYYERVKISTVGSVAPEFTLKSTTKKEYSLSDFKGKGKDVLLCFDLKNAPQNEAYFELLKTTQKELKDKVTFVAILVDVDSNSLDDETIKIANSIDWVVLLAGKKWISKEVRKYNVTTAPYMILISDGGVILERDITLSALADRYNTSLSEEKKEE